MQVLEPIPGITIKYSKQEIAEAAGSLVTSLVINLITFLESFVKLTLNLVDRANVKYQEQVQPVLKVKVEEIKVVLTTKVSEIKAQVIKFAAHHFAKVYCYLKNIYKDLVNNFKPSNELKGFPEFDKNGKFIKPLDNNPDPIHFKENAN